MIPTAYKVYAFDGTDYTDISSKVINDPDIPVMIINPDQTPILQGFELETVEDLSNTLLPDNGIVCIEIDSIKKWYGYVESSHYDSGSLTYFYNVFNIFENLKNKTCYTHLAPIVHLATYNGRSAFDNVSSIYSGTSVISWNDCTLKELIETIFESDFYNGLVNTVTWSLGTGMTTIMENFCISSLCVKNIGTDFSDEEITAVTTDPNIIVWDFLSELFKMLGLRYYYTGIASITIVGTDTAPSTTDYKGALYDFGKWVNKYDYNTKKLKELKKFVVKQNILNIADYETELDVHRYFTPLIYGLPRINITNAYNSGSNLILKSGNYHKIPSSNLTMFNEMYFLGILNTSLQVNEDMTVLDNLNFTLLDRSVEQTRYIQTNIGTEFNIVSLTHAYISDYFSIVLSKETSFSTPYDMIISGFYTFGGTLNATYTYEAGTGNPSAVGKFRVQADGITIIFSHPLGDQLPYIYETDTGIAKEYRGTTGTPVYAAYALAGYSATYNSQTDEVILLVCGSDPSLVSGDSLHVINVSDAIDGEYAENTTSALSAGEYYNAGGGFIYLYDNGQDSVPNARIKPVFPKYLNYKNATSDGKTEQVINLRDYLVIYRPAYSTASDWKEDWFTVDMELTDNTLLFQAALYAPWWLYTYNEAYQTVVTESYNVDDTVVPVLTTSRKVIYNVRDHSINIEQDSV